MVTIEKNTDLYNAVKDALEELELEPRFDYSGRFMCGKTCFGIVGRFSDCVKFLPLVQRYLTDTMFLKEFEQEKIIEEIEKITDKKFVGMRTDQMAYDVIFYWPNVKVEVID